MSQQTDTPLFSDTNHRLGVILDSLTAGLVGPLVDGAIPLLDWSPGAGSAARGDMTIQDLRFRFLKHLRSAGKFPDYCDVGSGYFYPVYDWHVRHGQPIQLTRTAENQMVIQLMATQLVLRPDMDPTYCGQPYDK